MKMTTLKSSNINAIGFTNNLSIDSDRPLASCGVLRIEFVHGAIYDYKNVPEKLFKDFLEAESAGKFFHAKVKDKFSTVKVD